MKVFVIGGGGREHALCWAISRSPIRPQVYCAPGNAGIARVAECVDIGVDDLDALVDFAVAHAIDLVVVGPEDPLAAGLVDRLEQAGISAFGPCARGAQLEASKAFMKDLCSRASIPTAAYRQFDEPESAKDYVRAHGAPIVIKADGLAAGKGVVVCRTANEAYAAIDHILVEGAFGKAGANIVVESFIEGEEATFLALVDGERILPLASSQDHKPAFDGDHGPNTGGMGAYSPAPAVTDKMANTIVETILRPAITALSGDGIPYRGVLYAGLMITERGPVLLEFNCRFGDPECQPIVMRLRSDLLAALVACSQGRLNEISLDWHDDAALTVVMAAKGYPGYYSKGTQIKGLEKLESMEGVQVFHAGTVQKDGAVLANGGRVLGVTALGRDVAAAQQKAYRAVNKIEWRDGFWRTDIGWRAVRR